MSRCKSKVNETERIGTDCQEARDTHQSSPHSFSENNDWNVGERL